MWPQPDASADGSGNEVSESPSFDVGRFVSLSTVFTPRRGLRCSRSYTHNLLIDPR